MEFVTASLPVVLPIAYALGMISVFMTLCGYSVLAERKISSWIQGRVGPNRARVAFLGYIPILGNLMTRLGLFQPAADGLKFLFTEEITPGHVKVGYYYLAPIVALAPALTTMVVLPFGRYVDADGMTQPLVLANIDLGMLFILAISSLGVYGIVLAGWASNSKYALLGSIRGLSQLISYELAMGLSLVPVVMMARSFSLTEIVMAQEKLPYLLLNPLAFLIFLISVLAESKRTPFDLPEAENELVAGFHTEYSGMRFGLFFVGEYINMIILGAMVTVFFLGGWHGPWLPGVVWFIVKVLAVCTFFIWVRGSLPRLRYDQLMHFGWKILLPLSLLNVLVTGAILLGLN